MKSIFHKASPWSLLFLHVKKKYPAAPNQLIEKLFPFCFLLTLSSVCTVSFSNDKQLQVFDTFHVSKMLALYLVPCWLKAKCS